MIRSLKSAMLNEKERFRIPKSVQETIPIDELYADGVFKSGKKYTKTFAFSDINYFVVSQEEQEAMFGAYGELLNSLDTDAIFKITINNRAQNPLDFKEKTLLKKRNDNLNQYRDEYNRMLLEKGAGHNNLIQEKYITVSTIQKTIEEARAYFERIESELANRFSKIDVNIWPMDAVERLRIFHDFFRSGEEMYYKFDLAKTRSRGHSFKDYICPDVLEIKRDHLRIDDKFARVLYLREYASSLKDTLVKELCSLEKNMMLSIDIIPVGKSEATNAVENISLGVETEVTKFTSKQVQRDNITAIIPHDLVQKRQETNEMLIDLTENDKRMMFTTVTVIHMANSLIELDSDTKRLLTIAQGKTCQMSILRAQQLDGLKTVLPYGRWCIKQPRTMVTDSAAVLIPFKVKELCDIGGGYYGQNAVSKNLILANRNNLQNGNGYIIGVSGSGKSFAGKGEMVSTFLSTDDDVIVIDPESEYSPLINALGGTVVRIASDSQNCINAMEINRFYNDGANPIALKIEFIMSLCEQLVGGEAEGSTRSIIDRALRILYKPYINSEFRGTPPTLTDFAKILNGMEEPEAHTVALSLELYTTGSLNIFAHQTNVNMNNHLLCFDIRDLGSQLKSIGMLVVLDAIINRITKNREQKKRTWLYIDEIYLLFSSVYSREFLMKLWKRSRKYGTNCTGITQNIEDILQTDDTRKTLANSEFLLILNQAPTDRQKLKELFDLSPTQLKAITNSDKGSGLIKVGGSIVPFENHFLEDTQLYKLMTTKPSEVD